MTASGQHRRGLRRLLVVAAGVGVLVLGGAPAASAHPLGNATINHYDGLALFPDHLVDTAIEDAAELPTLQRGPLIDTNGDGQRAPAERAAYAAAQCAALARTATITVDAAPVTLTVTASTYDELPGAVQLRIGRLECQLRGDADLTRPATVGLTDQWDSAGIGWHEITATGTEVSLQNSPVPPTSISNQLRQYPNDLLSSPLNVRSTTISTKPGSGASTYSAAVQNIPGAGFVLRALNGLSTSFNNLVGAQQMTFGVGLLAILLSITLGAGHAFLPGHGKTIMAAYLVGKRGRLRDVVTVGATVTATHTLGVLALGVLLSVSTAFAPTAVEQDLAVLSGLIIAGVGVGLLISAIRRRHSDQGLAGWAPSVDAGPLAGLDGSHAPTSLHTSTRALAPVGGAMPAVGTAGRTASPGSPRPIPNDTPDDSTGHGHGHGHGHRHGHGHGFSRGGLIGLGVAGGLVPSPSALLVLLAAIALGRTVLGIVLVLGYGLGMAVALSAAGLLLVRLRGRVARLLTGSRINRASRILAVLPMITAGLVIIVGAGLVLRALSGSV